MKISTKGRYALRMLIDLAQHQKDGYVALQDIAVRQNISKKYLEQIEKMYSISGDNDYVNVLGIKIIPEDHTVYVKTPTDVYDFPNSHGLVDVENKTGNLYDFTSGEFYEQTNKQRELAITAKALSENIMNLPPEEREDVCRSLMTILEFGFNQAPGLNGEFATPEEFLGFISYSDDVLSEILFTWDGQKFIHSTINDALKKVLNVFPDSSYKIVTGYLQNDMTIIWQKTK